MHPVIHIHFDQSVGKDSPSWSGHITVPGMKFFTEVRILAANNHGRGVGQASGALGSTVDKIQGLTVNPHSGGSRLLAAESCGFC